MAQAVLPEHGAHAQWLLTDRSEVVPSSMGTAPPLEAKDDLASSTLIILLWGCDMSREAGGLRDSGLYRHRWQAAPTSFGALDGPGSSFRRWLQLFSSREPVCLGGLPSGVGFRRLHVGGESAWPQTRA